MVTRRLLLAVGVVYELVGWLPAADWRDTVYLPSGSFSTRFRSRMGAASAVTGVVGASTTIWGRVAACQHGVDGVGHPHGRW